MTTPAQPVSEITALSDQAITWVILLHSGNATEQDRIKAQQWQERSHSHQKAYAEAEQLWLDMGDALLLPVSSQPICQPIPITNQPRKQIPPARWLAPLAAAVLLLAILNPYLSFSDYWLSDYHTAVGEQKNIVLSDGSRILLDTDTAISVRVGQFHRNIKLLRGQAVFTVAADPNRPFEVTTDDAVVRALGTVFEVLEDNQGTQVTVEEHAVSIRPLTEKGGVNTVRINEGQQTRYNTKTGFEPITDINIKQNAAWQRGKLIFKNQELSDVIAELNRYYKGHILLTDNKLASLRVTGVFPLNDPQAVLSMIEQTLPLKQTHITPWLTLINSL
ncbi:MAG: FecR family protein [Methyloglobulus sp.]|nr:FecR family protein [Methyloglobulus sp.]